jgi:hypothetical protein
VLARHSCPASKARLRAVCAPWHDALAATFASLHIGPGNVAWLGGGGRAPAQHPLLLGQQLRRAFPAASSLHLAASSMREYECNYTQVCARACVRASEQACECLHRLTSTRLTLFASPCTH